jgi:hypothetical protein
MRFNDDNRLFPRIRDRMRGWLHADDEDFDDGGLGYQQPDIDTDDEDEGLTWRQYIL